jgi:hypothetical protein
LRKPSLSQVRKAAFQADFRSKEPLALGRKCGDERKRGDTPRRSLWI